MLFNPKYRTKTRNMFFNAGVINSGNISPEPVATSKNINSLKKKKTFERLEEAKILSLSFPSLFPIT